MYQQFITLTETGAGWTPEDTRKQCFNVASITRFREFTFKLPNGVEQTVTEVYAIGIKSCFLAVESPAAILGLIKASQIQTP